MAKKAAKAAKPVKAVKAAKPLKAVKTKKAARKSVRGGDQYPPRSS